MIVHPYVGPCDDFIKSTKIEVEVEGETLKGVPHGLCFIYFVYNGQFHGKDYKKPSSTDIYNDG